mmetsp:Transcript_18782/g.28928  ORF Transcript_18782/g.28928 Transcript_18782/m.28928 type:complete len:89 (+) Transcript_18782:414-680(+)
MGSASDSTDLEISFMHYTADSRISMDSTNSYFPSASSGTSAFSDTTSYSGTAEYPRHSSKNGFKEEITWADLKTEMSTYLSNVDDYYD